MLEQRSIITNARYLRKEATKAEQVLWQKLRNKNLGIRFRRQHPFDMFIVDFYAPSPVIWGRVRDGALIYLMDFMSTLPRQIS